MAFDNHTAATQTPSRNFSHTSTLAQDWDPFATSVAHREGASFPRILLQPLPMAENVVSCTLAMKILPFGHPALHTATALPCADTEPGSELALLSSSAQCWDQDGELGKAQEGHTSCSSSPLLTPVSCSPGVREHQNPTSNAASKLSCENGPFGENRTLINALQIFHLSVRRHSSGLLLTTSIYIFLTDSN